MRRWTSTRSPGPIPSPASSSAATTCGRAVGPTAGAGHETLLVAEVIESADHLREVLDAAGADDLLLVRLEARLATLRRRIIARESPGWAGLDHLLGETEPLYASLPKLDGVHLALDTEQLGPTEIAERVRAARTDKLAPKPR